MDDSLPRPSIEVMPYDEDHWEVLIDTTTGLNASVKVGYLEDGRPFVILDPDSDDDIHDESMEGFAYFVAGAEDG